MSTQTPSRSQRPMSDQPTMNRPMSDQQHMQGYDMDMSDRHAGYDQPVGRRGGKPGSETKPAFLTTEFYVFLAAVGGVIAASVIIGNDNAGLDVFRADRAWFFIALLSIGYMLSRGIAKAGKPWRRGGNR